MRDSTLNAVRLTGLLWSFFSASLVIYLLPLIFESQVMRILVFDSAFFFVFFILTGCYFKGGYSLAFLLPFSFFCIGVFSFFINGLLYSKYGEDVLREFRFFFFFICSLFSFYIYSVRGDEKSFDVTVVYSLFGVFLGNLSYFLITKYLFWDYGLYYIPEDEFGSAYSKAFTLGVEQKFKYYPPFFIFFQLLVFSFYKEKRIPSKVFFLTSIALLLLAVLSNMRSSMLAEFLAIIIILMSSIFNGRSKSNLIGALLLCLPIFLVALFFEDFLTFFGNARFEEQISSKGVNFNELSNRLNGLLISFGIVSSNFQTFFGNGAGSAYAPSLWSTIALNPADSAFFHLLLSGGFLLLVSYLSLSFIIFVKAVLNVLYLKNLISIILLSSFLLAFLNNFNDSLFLSMSDVYVYSIICAWVLGLKLNKGC